MEKGEKRWINHDSPWMAQPCFNQMIRPQARHDRKAAGRRRPSATTTCSAWYYPFGRATPEDSFFLFSYEEIENSVL
jgi:hypothetical protein